MKIRRPAGLSTPGDRNAPIGPSIRVALPLRRFKVSTVQMKLFGLFIAILLTPAFTVSAQVTVNLTLQQDQFLPGEALPVDVHITNQSGQPLHFGADPDWLTFSVEAEDDFIVVKNSDPPVQGEFNLESSQVATKRVDLEPCFNLKQAGHYRIIATVRIKDWNTDIASQPKGFDVIDGAKLWSQVFGVPLPAGVSNRPPEVRKYTLEEANYLHSQLRMYVRVSDESGATVFKVRAIGPMVSFSQPEEQLDQLSNLHVLYQSGAASFLYSVINPNGDLVSQEIYDYFDVRPRLRVANDGSIRVLGGVRRVKPQDIPQVRAPDQLSAPAK